MLRDIDYAAVAVKTAIEEKYGRNNPLENLSVVANEATISVEDGEHTAEGTRDHLLIVLRKSGSYENFWELAAAERSQPAKSTSPR